MANHASERNISPAELSELIGRIYASVLSHSWSEFFDSLIEHTCSNKAVFFLRELKSDASLLLEFHTNFEYQPEVLREYHERSLEDPYYQVTRYAPEGSVIKLSDHINIDEHRDTDFYRNLLVPLKAHKVLAAFMIRNAEHESMIALNRAEMDRDYGEADIALLRMLAPHLRQAAQIFKTLKLHQNQAELFSRIVQGSDTPIVVCDQDANVLLVNNSALSYLDAKAFVSIEGGRLTTKSLLINKRLHRSIQKCSQLFEANISTKDCFLAYDDIDSHDILIQVTPLKARTGINDVDIPASMVTFKDNSLLDWVAVKETFRLTAKELALLKALHSNRKLNELTNDFNVTYYTLKTHLQSLFRKCAVSSQVELMLALSKFGR